MSVVIFKGKEVEVVSLGGVDHSDYPDYCDAYIEEAYYLVGEDDLTDDELDELQEIVPMYELIVDLVL